MRELAAVLRDALPSAATPAARRAAEDLRTIYRSGAAPGTLAVSDPQRAAAYAAYRMPATSAALYAALTAGLTAHPGLALSADLATPALDHHLEVAAPAHRDAAAQPHSAEPAEPAEPAEADDLATQAPLTHLDVGGGTGAAVWAVHRAWPGRVRSTVIDASAPALALGADLARRSGDPALASTTWESRRLAAPLTLPAADLVTIGYVLGELPDPLATALIDAALNAARTLLIVEPGTPRGYAAVLAARTPVLAAGWRLLAPCPHARACPLPYNDWCHMAVRVPRSGLHRDLKGGELGWEDEKYTYLMAVAPAPHGPLAPPTSHTDATAPSPAQPTPYRVLRHPLIRKGLVQLTLCRPDGTTAQVTVSKRQGAAYRLARHTAWGDTFPDPRASPPS